MSYKEVNGNLITLALENNFDVITHGCNCMCNMASGIAVPMSKIFQCNTFPLENEKTRGDINKLGQIDYKTFTILGSGLRLSHKADPLPESAFYLTVVNSYSQYIPSRVTKPLDYEALTLCLRKINFQFKGLRVGLPLIGCGLAGGDWNIVSEIIKKELIDCDVTIVFYNEK